MARCPGCGFEARVPGAQRPTLRSGAPQPAAYPPAQPAYAPPPQAAGLAYPPPRPTNTLAIVSLVLSLVGFAILVTAPVGLILGIVAANQIKQTGEAGRGMAIAGIAVGAVITGFGILYFFFIFAVVFAAI